MKTDNAHSIIATLGEIEDSMAQNQIEHAQLAGAVKSEKEYMKTLEGELFNQVEGDTDGQRKANAKAALHVHKDYIDYLRKTKRLGTLDQNFEYLKARQSICQTAVGYLKEELKAQGFGQAQGQAGHREPQ
jgi:hypothetical protein